MVGLLYDKELTCPVCEKDFTSKYPRDSRTILKDRDADFCPYYENEENPLFYKPVICPRCGYGALARHFGEVKKREGVQVLREISQEWSGRDHCGLRELKDAIRCYQHCLDNAKVMEKKDSIKASISIRVAWCFRYEGSSREKKFLREALQHYKQAYEKEKLPAGNMDELTLLYVIGELNRRLENIEPARKHFSQVIEHPKKHRKPRIVNLTRDQWQSTKDAADQ